MKDPEPDKPKPFLSRQVILFVVVVAVIGSVAYFALNYYMPVESVEPETVKKIQPEPEKIHDVDTSKFNIADFDKCTKLLIAYVKIHPIEGQVSYNTPDEIKRNGILSEYNKLNCYLVEEQLSQSSEYENRNVIITTQP